MHYLLINLFCVYLGFFQSFIKNIFSYKSSIFSSLKFRLYNINENLYFPKSFEIFTFNWSKTIPVVKSQTTGVDNTKVALYLVYYDLLKSSFLKNLLFRISLLLKSLRFYLSRVFSITLGDGFLYLRGLFVIFFVDALIADDEPIWEPVEWSLLQSWILFIFLFAWIAENLISSRYGSYTGRDKRVWFSWYKTFWLIDIWYVISMGAASLWVMVPHYYEITYGVSFIFSWWNWYNRVFFFKFISLFSLVLFVAYFLQISIRSSNWKKSFYLILLINFFLGYLLYTQFFISFFGYFTDPRWHSKTRLVDYVQLSHEPARWGWGDPKRDHFTHHMCKTVFWFKNDGPFASAFLFYNFLFFISLFSLYFYWIALVRRVYVTQEVTFTFTTYCVSSLKQFFYTFLLLFLFVFYSYMFIYWRTPNEFLWIINSQSWLSNFLVILKEYPSFIISIV